MDEAIIVEEGSTHENKCEDSTEALLEKYDRKRTQKFDDITAMQAVICILLAVALFAVNMAAPELSKPVFMRLKELSADEKEVIPNLIDLIIALWSRL